MQKSYQNPGTVATPIGPYSHVARVETGDTVFLYISGQLATDAEGKLVGEGDITAQTDQVYRNLGAILAANGATFADVIKYTTFLVNIADRPVSGEARAKFVKEPFPASTLVAVSALVRPEYLIEVEAVAVLSR